MTPTDPAPPEPAIQSAARLLAEGDPARAAQELAALVASAPTYAAAHVLRATALEAAGSVDEAIVSWGRAAALVPRSPLVHRERARLLATRLAPEPPPDLPAAEPDPDRQPSAGEPPAEAAPELSAAPEVEEPSATGPNAPGAESGWVVLGETDIPTPPPNAHAEPNVVTPEPEPPPTPAEPDDLDALITQLEDAPRIRPDPDYRGPEVALDAGNTDDVASETLAKIYVAQNQYAQAALVYETLAARRPDQADALLERAAELRQRRA